MPVVKIAADFTPGNESITVQRGSESPSEVLDFKIDKGEKSFLKFKVTGAAYCSVIVLNDDSNSKAGTKRTGTVFTDEFDYPTGNSGDQVLKVKNEKTTGCGCTIMIYGFDAQGNRLWDKCDEGNAQDGSKNILVPGGPRMKVEE